MHGGPLRDHRHRHPGGGSLGSVPLRSHDRLRRCSGCHGCRHFGGNWGDRLDLPETATVVSELSGALIQLIR